jgi:hypothetical protein
MLKVRLVVIALGLIVVGCADSNSDMIPSVSAPPRNTTVTFPDPPTIDSTVYKTIQQTCKERWDLANMNMATLNIRQDTHGDYIITCDGYSGSDLYRFEIRTTFEGIWVNDIRGKKNP